MRTILQMRRAVRDYKYEVNEGKMTDECVQYLTQLQKDWERHRVKLGVKALRQEVNIFALLLKYGWFNSRRWLNESATAKEAYPRWKTDHPLPLSQTSVIRA